MNRPYYSAYLNKAPDHFFYVQNTVHFEPCASCQAFSRQVSEVATVLCTMHADDTTESRLYCEKIYCQYLNEGLTSALTRRFTVSP